MAQELEQEFNASTKLIAGGGGVFDVTVDGKQVFSKHSLGRFPNPGEVKQLIKNRG